MYSLNCNKIFKYTIIEDHTAMARFPEDDQWPQTSFSPTPFVVDVLQFPTLLSESPPEPTKRQSSDKGNPSSYQITDQAQNLKAEPKEIAPIDTTNPLLYNEERAFRRVYYQLEHLVPMASGANWFGNSRLPLIQAAAQGNARWVQELLRSSDIEPDVRSFQGWTALQQACAAESGQVEAVVKQLINHGADINAAPGHGYSMTALQAACRVGRKPLVELLLNHGADINAPPGGDGYTALGEACFSGHTDVVHYLLEEGAQVNQNIQQLQGSSALTAAAQNGSWAVIELLLKYGADPKDASALQRAVSWGHDEVAKHLVELGAAVNAPPCVQSEGHGCRHTAIASAESLSMIEYLVAHGADVNGAVCDEGGATAVQRAAAFHSTEILEELIRLGGDVNAPAAAVYGRTALQAAAYHGRNSHVKLLVDKYSAVINTPRSTRVASFSALEAAAYYTAKMHPEDNEQANPKSLNMVEFLLDRGAELTALPLHMAAAWGDERLGELLLRMGADPNLPPEFSLTFPTVDCWGDDRDMGSTVFETARLNGRMQFLIFLEDWCKIKK